MTLEKGKIPSSYLILLLIGFIFGSSVVLTPGRFAGQNAWLAILIGAVEGLIFIFVFCSLAERFKGKSFVEIADIVYGQILGKILSTGFVLYLFHLGSLVIGNFSDFFTTAVMPQTPSIVFAISLILVCALAVHYGIEVIARISLVLVVTTILFSIVISVLQMKEIHIENFFPILNLPLGKFLYAVHGVATFPFAETVAFLMVIPFVTNGKSVKISFAIAVSVATIFFLLAIIRTVGTLGVTEGIFTYPSYEAVKLLSFLNLNTRLEIVIAINFLTMGFLKITVLYYGSVLGMAQIFKLKSYRPLIQPIGILLVIISLVNFHNIAENIELAELTYPIYALLFQLLIPLLTLIIAFIRKLPEVK